MYRDMAYKYCNIILSLKDVTVTVMYSFQEVSLEDIIRK